MRQAAAKKTWGDEAVMAVEFLTAYLQAQNQLAEVRSRLDRARNEDERRKALLQCQSAGKRCDVLRSLVFPHEA